MLDNDFLDESARLFPNKVALIFQNRRLSFFEIQKSTDYLSNALIHYGLQQQDRVAIFLENSIESVISIFGILKASGVFILLVCWIRDAVNRFWWEGSTRHYTNISCILDEESRCRWLQ